MTSNQTKDEKVVEKPKEKKRAWVWELVAAIVIIGLFALIIIKGMAAK